MAEVDGNAAETKDEDDTLGGGGGSGGHGREGEGRGRGGGGSGGYYRRVATEADDSAHVHGVGAGGTANRVSDGNAA